ncbi:uncharacterized protein LOC120625160 isoform X2 [Pararge aegeria]|uniref:uncharacterized protein LOC120625160 isoform X2 n=1 Tax=Pararge aegeria TaxID=116150 RepID=UPI0019D1ED8F|nr:uncharacterized protein LOC120625160 isoform X2 [Pararge aegeria]
MYKLIVLFSVFLYINDTNAQYKMSDGRIQQTTKLTPHSPTYKIVRNVQPMGLAAPQSQMMKPKGPKRRLTKRQQVAETLKQQAIRNIIAAKTVINKEPVPANVSPQIKKLAAPNNVASEILVWRS